MKQISKSKRQLAQLLIEAGVKKFPEGANWAAQDSDGGVRGHEGKPKWQIVNKYWWEGGESWLLCRSDRIANFHQTILSRADFDQLVAESAEQSKPDEDGWVQWKGGECPVQRGTLVDVKYANGVTNIGVSALTDATSGDHTCGTQARLIATNWDCESPLSGIVAYRLHKPEQVEPQCCESVTPENFAENIDVERARNYMASRESERAATPTLDQLLQDYRNAADFAATKQAEADEAAKMRDEQWKVAQARACELGVRISVELIVDAEMRESEPVITDWRDLRVGDVIWFCGEARTPDGEYRVTYVADKEYCGKRTIRISTGKGSSWWIDNSHEWRFIRRP